MTVNKKQKIKFFAVISLGIICLFSLGIYLLLNSNKTQTADDLSGKSQEKQEEDPKDVKNATKQEIAEPLMGAKQRITKKPFGIYITPDNSPVQPERFKGYHTGADFEITEEELNQNIPVFAICDGQIVRKRNVSGYGGVIIQECKIENQPVTILYGHISLVDLPFKELDRVTKETQLTILATDKSEESGGERKHLHLGIKKGTIIDYTGYVNSENELTNWVDIADYL